MNVSLVTVDAQTFNTAKIAEEAIATIEELQNRSNFHPDETVRKAAGRALGSIQGLFDSSSVEEESPPSI